jgi:hypothetical protein
MLCVHSYVCGKINLRLEVREEGFYSLWIWYSVLNMKVATSGLYHSLQDLKRCLKSNNNALTNHILLITTNLSSICCIYVQMKAIYRIIILSE